MSTYKITNLTNLSGKREIKHNSIIDIDYVDSMVKKTINVKPGETVYLKIASLPLSIHKLRVKNFISVVEINDTELKNVINAKKISVSPINDVEKDKKKIVSISSGLSDDKEVLNTSKRKIVKKMTGDESSDTD